ncbi:hypothetical protein [Nocardia sp. NPDC059228]|uniref:hypothetical protein n=1 Tax=Nocardia sp. NPDC059228 TaxID=3346777 RepID=UPI0036A80259
MTDEPEEIEPAARTRLFPFPGGVLELQACGSETEDYAEFHLEIHEHIALDGHQDSGAIMKYKPTAVGYLRTDVSRVGQLWDQTEIRRLAARFGYDFADMIVYDPSFGRPPLARLRAQITRLDAEAVFVPSLSHFEDGELPGSLVQQLDVITVHPEETYSRMAMPSLRDLRPR